MRLLSRFFFYAYGGLALAAGLWGAFGNPAIDFRILFRLDIHQFPPYTRINLADQYRFLRALEFGIGLYAFLFAREIFSLPKFNMLFLTMMTSGTLARIVSLVHEGRPSFAMCFFMVFELTGIIVISLYSYLHIYRQKLKNG